METFLLSVLLIIQQWTWCSGTALQVIEQEYCQSQMFQAQCASDEVVLMHTAQYGRLNMGRCVTEDFGFVGHCDYSVLAQMDRMCSGKHSCELKVEDPTFPSASPCHTDLKSFLYASYSCVPVTMPSPACKYSDGHVLKDSDGYISSLVTRETGCGLMGAPWKIVLEKGQTINISLIDFNPGNVSQLNSPLIDTTCRVYATIRDTSTRPSKTICGEKARQHHIYTSLTNEVEIRIMGSQSTNNEPEFLLYYQAVGCPEVVAPSSGWVRKTDSGEVHVGCDSDGRSWKLTCQGTQWIGRKSNCTTDETHFIDKVVSDVTSLPAGISIGLVVVIAVIVGSCILVAGIFCIRYKLKRSAERTPPIVTTVPMEAGAAVKPTAHPASPPPYPGEQGSRENEYASMRLLPPTPDSLYDKQNSRNSQMHDGVSLSTTYDRRRCQSPDHIYESPEPDRRVSSTSGTAGYRTASPQYFDLDPRVMTVQGGMPSREGNYCTCLSQGANSGRGECNKHSV